MKFEGLELVVVKGMLIGAMQEMNRRIDEDQYISKDEKEMFEIMKGMIEKLEESE